MPLIRIIALAALVLIAALAILWLMPSGEPYEDRLGQFIILFFAAGNAFAVSMLASAKPRRAAGIGPILILSGVVLVLALETIEYWIDWLVPGDGSALAMLAQFNMFLAFAEPLFWSGLLAPALGWIVLGASHLAARRAGRVASAPQLPI
jgi:hypothetical protein